MSKLPVTAIFDIGKTNKKFFLFDRDYQVVHQSYTRFDPVPDEDGFPAEALQAMSEWMLTTFLDALKLEEFEIKALNFSTHGASFVHVDEQGDPATPLYDYLKPFPEDLLMRFYKENGGKMNFCRATSSPPLAMLNSGLQLYFLKFAKPEKFKNIKHSFHLPQFVSFLFSGEKTSDFTSIGCHTGLWDFEKEDYHSWVDREGIRGLLPPIKSGKMVIRTKPELGNIPCGIGIHDSSAALLPYLKQESEPFILLSTGTWAIAINPFNKSPLTKKELKRDCLQFLSVLGEPIKISRLFIGEEHKFQIESMYAHFHLERGTYKKLTFDDAIYQKVRAKSEKRIAFHYLKPGDFGLESADKTDWSCFEHFEEAYYTFMDELTDLQLSSLNLVLEGSSVKRIFIDGGFNANPIFLEMLRKKLPELEIIPSDFPNGSALGAAMLINEAMAL
ncbi:FGGY-family carbohydrate kinase [Algoriphagus namhaensis]